MNRVAIFTLAAAAVVLVTGAAKDPIAGAARFEPEPRALFEGRSPMLAVRRQHGLYLLYSSKSPKGGMDLWVRSSQDVGDTFGEPMRVNDQEGEVSDHGENSAQLLLSPDQNTLYVVWNGRDPAAGAGTHIRFARSGAMAPAWSKAVTINDDGLAVSHSFQSAAVGPDGTLWVAWLDGREKEGRANMEGTSALYLARSFDGGKTWSKNVRIAGNVCPCCRAAIGFLGGKVFVFWRGVEPDHVRDIYWAASTDRGASWTAPQPVARDGWRINGCPHVGPAVATAQDKLWVVWFTEANGDPSIMAAATHGGSGFTPPVRISEGVTDPTHPAVASDGQRVAVTFQARDAAAASGWGKMQPFYREIRPGGTLSRLQRLPIAKANASYPSIALGLSGRVFVAWTETIEGRPHAMLLRGRTQ